MTRKDYKLIAGCIKKAIELRDESISLHTQNVAIRNVAKLLADELAKDNPNFDRAKFLTACDI